MRNSLICGSVAIQFKTASSLINHSECLPLQRCLLVHFEHNTQANPLTIIYNNNIEKTTVFLPFFVALNTYQIFSKPFYLHKKVESTYM